MRKLIGIAALGGVLGGGAVAQTAAPVPAVELYGALPAAQQARLSPDGNSLAVIAPVQNHNALVVWHLGGVKPTAIPTGDYEPSWFEWKSDTRLLASIRYTRFQASTGIPHADTRTIATSPDGGGIVQMKVRDDVENFSGSEITTGADGNLYYKLRNVGPQLQDRVVSLLPNDPNSVLIEATPVDDFVHTQVLKVDVTTGAATPFIAKHVPIVDWMADPTGAVRLGISLEKPGTTESVQKFYLGDEDWTPIYTHNLASDPRFSMIAFSVENPNILYVAHDQSNGRQAIAEFDVKTRTIVRDIAADAERDAQPIVNDGRLVGYQIAGKPSVYLDPAWAKDAATMRKALPGAVVDIVDRSRDGTRVLAKVVDGNTAADYWLLDRRGSKTGFVPVIENYKGIAASRIAAVKPISYPSRDGLTIPGFLTLPVNYKGGAIPFVVLPHGGPTANDSGGFDFMAQFIADMGYGVLQPQFRGSTGYGMHFTHAGFREWGAKIQDDITDGTQWLIQQGYADPQKICMVGGSFGGYATLMGLVREPTLYRCGVALAPVTDLGRLLSDRTHFLYSDVNNPQVRPDGKPVDDYSPVEQVSHITRPVLLVHGRKDFTVPVYHTEAMEQALRKAGKPVEALYLDGADHFLSHGEDRIAFLSALQRFLLTNLGPVRSADSAAQ